MTIIQAIISGVVQGLTEFLPISSSGHLVILHSIFRVDEPTVFFDIFLHIGTLLAVIIYFWNDIVNIIFRDRKKLLAILLATVPIVTAALVFGERIEGLFARPRFVLMMFMVTAAWLLMGSLALGFEAKSKGGGEADSQRPNIFIAFLIGIAQAVALIPGISRSGATISTGLILGVDKESAFRFSFLLSIPAILGALAYKIMKEYPIILGEQYIPHAVGALVACVVGIMALGILSKVLRQKKLAYFSAYCFIMGVFGLLVLYLKDIL